MESHFLLLKNSEILQEIVFQLHRSLSKQILFLAKLPSKASIFLLLINEVHTANTVATSKAKNKMNYGDGDILKS
ncbi:CLUMA_CG012426, isoform A [Clunio marinus]|uniref:CLUMA_CG012426, isoform A n=1 Tax=Clunio marinus TaxID=568069 RepID=A0A1J1IH78_9DIPT|nr:CLUMA_CG012426, isoform A [Clunio marinus]